jgi:hypothetical protein
MGSSTGAAFLTAIFFGEPMRLPRIENAPESVSSNENGQIFVLVGQAEIVGEYLVRDVGIQADVGQRPLICAVKRLERMHFLDNRIFSELQRYEADVCRYR